MLVRFVCVAVKGLCTCPNTSFKLVNSGNMTALSVQNPAKLPKYLFSISCRF